MSEELTEKQKRFCNEYLIDLNGTQAAIRAGYSEKTANRIASENLSKLDIQEYICELKNKRSERVRYSQDELMRDILEVKNRCMQANPVIDKEGNETGIWKFDSNGANKALDMLAKHVGFYETDNKQKAFNISVNREAVEVEGNSI
jgi:phage terminase small subunit